jgi:hypothetical protein
MVLFVSFQVFTGVCNMKLYHISEYKILQYDIFWIPVYVKWFRWFLSPDFMYIDSLVWMILCFY